MGMGIFLKVGAGLVIVSTFLEIRLGLSLALLLGQVVKVRLKPSPDSVMLNMSIRNRTIQSMRCCKAMLTGARWNTCIPSP